MQLDPRRMLTFREVARQRSFSRAAEALSLTQSAVSQQIAALEHQLGVSLMQRGRGGVRLTPAGERLLEHAAALADRVELAGVQLAELAAEEQRKLRIGAFPSALATLVPAAVARLASRMPELDVRLREGRLAELPEGVRSGELHAAVCFQDASAPRREHQGTRRHDLFDEPMVLALPPHHRLARRKSLSLDELGGEPWTAPSRDGLVARACREAGFEPRITIQTSDPLAIGAVVRAGLAVTLTPQLLAGQLPGVRILAVNGAPPRRAVYALLPDRGARGLDDQLVAELARNPMTGTPSGPRSTRVTPNPNGLSPAARHVVR
jgi:DNA-binding transcriptional LysR family regulator